MTSERLAVAAVYWPYVYGRMRHYWLLRDYEAGANMTIAKRTNITITPERADSVEAVALIQELEDVLDPLYPARAGTATV